jgi:NAD(P)-dependent dehydrogenase (short-subunit alcohol dehydrogenase family)
MKPLAGRIALVTGGSRGIGKGCALELAAAGATVYVTGRTVREGGAPLAGSLERTVREAGELGGPAIPLACDHADDEQVRRVFEQIEREQGRLDLLVNNVYSAPLFDDGAPFWETPLACYDQVNDVGTRSAYVATWFAAQQMTRRRAGAIVNVSSSGAVHFFHHVAYGMGKAALDKLTRDAGHQLREHGVAVVSVWPYFARTEMVLQRVAEGMPLPLDGAESQRFTGRAVVALASDEKLMEKSGKRYTARELAEEYGFRDVDGSLPHGPRPPSQR